MGRSSSARRHRKLRQLPATAICGNDITSSCLYVSALTIVVAGKWAPVCLLMVAAVLYLYRSIYTEVVGALPLNGGAYNALLNTTSKFRASIAACLTILSYMATAVISAYTAMLYVHSLWDGLPVVPATIVVLAVFMILTIIGITESSRVAIFIFVTHLATLTLLVIISIVFVMGHGISTLQSNLAIPSDGSPLKPLFLGFAAGMLGVSGFESSANYVEEQRDGVFPKTLRNMWIAVTVFNPTIALLALAVIPLDDIVSLHQKVLLASMGKATGGLWLSRFITVDAFLVLSGAVLTSYIGVNGLVRRMTVDRCLPQFFLRTNRRGTTHRILIGFFVLSVSILMITQGELKALAGVYTLSFLSVMALFGLGNILLKVRRARLPRTTRAAWITVLLGVGAVVAALVGNANTENAGMGPSPLRVFLNYFIPAMLIISIMLGRIALLTGCLYMARAFAVSLHRISLRKVMGAPIDTIKTKIQKINAQQVVFFTRGDNIANLNNAMLYILKNEHTTHVKIVTVVNDPKKVPDKLNHDLEYLSEVYPKINLQLVVHRGDFGPKLIKELSRKWNIPANFMFIGSPGRRLPYDLADLGGVRMII